MAVQQPILELQYLDASGSKGTVLMKAPVGTSYEDMDVSATALASIIAPLTGAVLMRQRIIYKSVVDPRVAADDSSPIEHAGVFYFASDDDEHQTLVKVPSFLEELYVTTEPGNGVLIDQSNGYVSSFIAAALETPICDPFGNLMGHIVSAFRQSRV
jgi:hypothetical protein